MKIIITGGSRGLGKALAKEFSRAGHQLGIVARTAADLQRACGEIGPSAQSEAADLTDAAQAEKALGNLARKMGGVDAFIHCAGLMIKKGIFELSPAEWRQCMAIQVDAAFNSVRVLAPLFRDQGHGHIVTISSLSTKVPLERGSVYTASKHAVNGFSRSMVHELHGLGVKVCTLYLGAFTTEEGKSWKVPSREIARSCEYIFSSPPEAFIEELVLRPLNWPE